MDFLERRRQLKDSGKNKLAKKKALFRSMAEPEAKSDTTEVVPEKKQDQTLDSLMGGSDGK